MSKQFSFGSVPTIKARRTKFDLSHDVKTSMSVGKLYPTYIQEVYPGDTFKVDSTFVARVTSAYLRPVMDNIYKDDYFFFVPSRLCYDRWEEVFGENKNGYWANIEDVEVPRINYGTVGNGGVADYMGIRPALSFGNASLDTGASVIPFRAFALIWNEWFRDQNNQDPVNVITGEFSSTYEKFNSNDWSPTNYTGGLPPVAKYHDYFTSCLPSPQKGDGIELNLASGFLPLRTSSTITPFNESTTGVTWLNTFMRLGAKVYNGTMYADYPLPVNSVFGMTQNDNLLVPMAQSNGEFPFVPLLSNDVRVGIGSSNLGIDSTELKPVTINDLRYAMQLQAMLELDARGGTRYNEYILSHFGVSSPDARLQRPEFLGGKRTPLGVQQVAQTTRATNDNENGILGSLGAYSLSNGSSRFSKGFVEHGFIIGVSALRYKHTYQQGLERFWTRSKRTDFYDPIFANIGEQPVYKYELYATDSNILNKDIFGYNEAWADLRYRPNKVTGQMRSNAENSLDIWHFADSYSSAPVLGDDFIKETPIFVNRTLAVDSDVQDQFIVDIFHKVDAIREMPLYSVPASFTHFK